MPAKLRPARGAKPAPRASPAPIKLGDLEVQPISIGTFWLLQEIDSPLLPGAQKPIEMKDVAAAVFILTAGIEAQSALAVNRAEFDRLAFAAASRVPVAELARVAAILDQAQRK